MSLRVARLSLNFAKGLSFTLHTNRNIVFTLLLVLGLSIAGVHAQSQPVKLQGRILLNDGRPIADATVEWVQRGWSVKSASDGQFLFTGSAALHFQAWSLEESRFRKHPLFGDFNILGASRKFENQKPGNRVSLMASQRYAPQSSKAGLGKMTVSGTDTLRIHKTGFEIRVIPIANPMAENLGDIILTSIASGNDVCAQQQNMRTPDGHEVILCEALYAQAPRIQLPSPPPSTVYAMMTADAFITTDGLTFTRARSNEIDAEIRRHASALYAITIQNGQVASFRPAILFHEALFIAPLIGRTFEGFISAKTSNGRYEPIPSLPIRLQITSEPYTGPIKPASAYSVKAKITNYNQALTASDGSCMPSLRSHGPQAPFASDEGPTLLIGRVPSMHAFGDNELVIEILEGGTSLGSLMSVEWFFTPLDLLHNTLAVTGTYSGVGHGTPGYIPMLELQAVTSGGITCNEP